MEPPAGVVEAPAGVVEPPAGVVEEAAVGPAVVGAMVVVGGATVVGLPN